MILSNSIWTNPAIILLLLLVSFGAIALIVFLIRKFVVNKNKVDEKPTESEVVKEDLDRYLETVDDEETQKAFDEYEESSKEEDK